MMKQLFKGHENNLVCFIEAVLALLLLICAQGCDESPTGRKQLSFIPGGKLASIGQQAFADLKHSQPVVGDPEINRYARCVAQRIIAALPEPGDDWEVVVFAHSSPNAFALPGRKIGINSGMLEVASSEDQLAAVISHEVAHLLADHANERLSQQLAVQGGLALLDLLSEEPGGWKHQVLRQALGLGADVGILLPFSRTHETEADTIGLELMARAGFDPRESVNLWQNMAKTADRKPVEFLSTHPSHESRQQVLQENMESALQLFNEAHSTDTCSGVVK
ncbi:MAG: M48 family metallopeptidase [Desulforhabdus sp.]|jgi:predicted Zn-dependent protease|nr:M48 family metallopeptidase [Desulforhabdus sp.]